MDLDSLVSGRIVEMLLVTTTGEASNPEICSDPGMGRKKNGVKLR